MDFCTIVHFESGNVYNIYVVQGKDEADVTRKTEKKFLELCENNIPDFGKFSADEKTQLLDDGYIEEHDTEIEIRWPLVVE